MVNNDSLESVVVATLTPYKDGELDKESLRSLLNNLMEKGVNGLFILGTTGEFKEMNLEQKKIVISEAQKIIDKRVPLLAGTTCKDLNETIELTKYAESLKPYAVVIAPLYINNDTLSNTQKILNSSKGNIFLYNNPTITNNKNMLLENINILSRNKRVIGIKDSSGDFDYFRKMFEATSSENFHVLQGNEYILLKSINLGARSCVSGMSNSVPELLIELFKTKNPETLERIEQHMREIKTIGEGNYTKGMKIFLQQKRIIYSSELVKE